MYNVFQQKILDENKRCCRLYPESGDLDTLLLIFFQARELLREQNPDIFEQVDCKMHPEEVKEKMKKSEKLIPDAHVQGEPVKIFLAGLCEELVKNNKDFEKPLEHLQTSIRDFLDENNDIFPQSQLPVLVEKVVEETLLDRDFYFPSDIYFFIPLLCAQEVLEEPGHTFGKKVLAPRFAVKPHYGFEGRRWSSNLECWLHGTSWRYPRVKCPYCETEDQENWDFLRLGKMKYAVYIFAGMPEILQNLQLEKYAEEGASAAAMHHLHTLHFDKLALKKVFLQSSGLKWVAKEDDGLVN